MGIEDFDKGRRLDSKLSPNIFSDVEIAIQRKKKAEAEKSKEAKAKDLNTRLAVNWDEKDAAAKLGKKYETTHGGREEMDRLREDKIHLRGLEDQEKRRKTREDLEKTL